MINSARLLTNILQWLNHDIGKITVDINDRYLLNQRMNRIMNRLSEDLSLHKVCLYNCAYHANTSTYCANPNIKISIKV